MKVSKLYLILISGIASIVIFVRFNDVANIGALKPKHSERRVRSTLEGNVKLTIRISKNQKV